MTAPKLGRIRPMTESDVPAVHALEQALFPTDAWPEQMFHEELRQGSTRHYFVAEDATGTIIAYAGLMAVAPIADIQTIAVVPGREGQGIGSQLLTMMIAEARERQMNDLMLEVRSDNPRAQDLYERYGFEQIHVRPRYYRDGADALVMRLQLTAGKKSPW